jgi:hypothetical protein
MAKKPTIKRKATDTYRNEVTIRTVEGHDVLITWRRFATISPEARKEMLKARRVEQLSRGKAKHHNQHRSHLTNVSASALGRI